ncbi:MAG: ABC transporter ATP-binding protein [Clostridia bacterium]|nr:ABC transporter ATP-binding protein [Clostridia bacterium]
MNALELSEVSKKYSSFQLGPVSLSLPRGCIMGLIGENGAGKSTLIKLILNMIQKDGGTVSVLGQNHKTVSVKEDLGVVLDEVGYPDCITPQQLNLILKNVYQNWDEEIYFSLLNQLSLPPRREFKQFSRGMKMKLGIAAALSHHPKLLILDEATNGLDPVVRDEVTELFSEFTREESHAVLISSHIVSDLEKLCDYIAFLHQGKLLLCEEKDRLLEQYVSVYGTAEQISVLPAGAVIGRKEMPYGVQAVVKKDLLPAGTETSRIGIEDLFLFMAKEERLLNQSM